MTTTRHPDGTLRDISARYMERRARIVRKANSGREMTDRELRLDIECFDAPDNAVIYATVLTHPLSEKWLEFTAVTVVSRSE